MTIAQSMAASAFFTLGLLHLFVWLQRRSARVHLWFALAAFAAGANGLAELQMYRSTTVPTMALAVKWYVAMSGLWLLAMFRFIVTYAKVERLGKWLATGLSLVVLTALAFNTVAPCSFLYSEIQGLREITLPWGETIRLTLGVNSPWRLAFELTQLAVLVLVFHATACLWRRGEKTRAWLFGLSLVSFGLFFGIHAFLVDTNQLESPYLSTYGFLGLAMLMSYDLAGGVVRATRLSSELKLKELELQTAVNDERNRIARDLHDSVTQTLFSTAAIADALPDVWDRHPEEARRGLADLRRLTKGVLAEMRTLLLELRPAAILEKNLGELLDQLADASVARTRVNVTTEITLEDPFPDEVQIALYRVAQEMLNNVVKHSKASHAKIALRKAENRVVLAISDNGQGFDAQRLQSGGLGLVIMRERVASIGARLRIDSSPKHGTVVEVTWSDGPDEG